MKLIVTGVNYSCCYDAKNGSIETIVENSICYGVDVSLKYIAIQRKNSASDSFVVLFDKNNFNQLKSSLVAVRSVHQIKFLDEQNLLVTNTDLDQIVKHNIQDDKSWYFWGVPPQHRVINKPGDHGRSRNDYCHLNSIFFHKNGNMAFLAHNWGPSNVFQLDSNKKLLNIVQQDIGTGLHALIYTQNQTYISCSIKPPVIFELPGNVIVDIEDYSKYFRQPAFPRGLIDYSGGYVCGVTYRRKRDDRDSGHGFLMFFNMDWDLQDIVEFRDMGGLLDICLLQE